VAYNEGNYRHDAAKYVSNKMGANRNT